MSKYYTLRNTDKKSVFETETWRKDGNIVVVETGWRWAAFTLTTDDGEMPDLDLENINGVNPYHLSGHENIEETEMDMLDDQVSFMVESEDLTEEELEELRERIEDESHMDVLEGDGWECEDTEFEITGSLTLEDDEGNEIAKG